MGPPPRSFAADAHHASWSGVSGPTAYKDVARTFVHPAAAPLGRRHPDHRKCAVVLGAIKDKALRVALRAILDRSCARRRLDRVGRDEETGCPGRTKKLTMK